jgi:hypothetical protein
LKVSHDAHPEVKGTAQSFAGVWSDCHPHREVMNLVYYQDKSIEEVAAIVGAPTNTVKTRMFYARHQLAELLREAGVDGL